MSLVFELGTGVSERFVMRSISGVPRPMRFAMSFVLSGAVVFTWDLPKMGILESVLWSA